MLDVAVELNFGLISRNNRHGGSKAQPCAYINCVHRRASSSPFAVAVNLRPNDAQCDASLRPHPYNLTLPAQSLIRFTDTTANMSHPTETISVTGTKRILVTGATGKQGRAVLDALLRRNSSDNVKYHVLALTRGTGGALANLPNVTIVRGDLDDVPAIFASPDVREGPYGVFSVQPAFGSGVTSENEVKQGKVLQHDPLS